MEAAYVKMNKYFISSQGIKILEITPELIQRALVYPSPLDLLQFTNTTMRYYYSTLLVTKQHPFLRMILDPGLEEFLITNSFPITIYADPIQPILSIFSHLLCKDKMKLIWI